jgi:hypothetical protein
MWDMYSLSQRRFDSFHNEWDLCMEFDPDSNPDGLADDTFSDYYGDPDETIYIEHCAKQGADQPSTVPHSSNPSVLPAQHDNIWCEDLMAVYDAGEEFHYAFDPPALKTVLYSRYGFSPSEIYDEPRKANMSWDILCKILGDTMGPVSTSLRLPIANFL